MEESKKNETFYYHITELNVVQKKSSMVTYLFFSVYFISVYVIIIIAIICGFVMGFEIYFRLKNSFLLLFLM